MNIMLFFCIVPRAAILGDPGEREPFRTLESLAEAAAEFGARDVQDGGVVLDLVGGRVLSAVLAQARQKTGPDQTVSYR